MASVSYADFNANTTGEEVTRAFSSRVAGKTILITGVNVQGLGYSAAQALVTQSPARIILAGRSPEKAQEAIDALSASSPSVDYRILQVNLSSQASVRRAAAEVLSWTDVPTIDLVINSAGVMAVQERTLSEEGLEMHFATNHIGHWLLTCGIMPKLIKAAESNDGVRIVNVSALAVSATGMRWDDLNFEKKNKDLPAEQKPNEQVLAGWGYTDIGEASYIPIDAYCRSKVANLLFSIGANRRLFEKHGIFTAAVHPGVIQTELARGMATHTRGAVDNMISKGFFTYKSLEAGSSTALVAALDPKLASGVGQTVNDCENWGAFLDDCQISSKCHPLAASSSEAERLWALSEKLTGFNASW